MKNLEISNLLLNEILKSPVEIINIGEFKCMIRNSTYFDNEQMGIVYRYLYGNREIRFISLYEIAFKCKEWIVTQGYGIKTETYDYLEDDSFSGTYWYIIKLRAKNYKDKGCPNCGANATEVEAIIKACEWVLEKEIQEENRLQLQEDLNEYNKLIKEGL